MSSRCPESPGRVLAALEVALVAGALLAAGCSREKRDFSPPTGAPMQSVPRASTLQPGEKLPSAQAPARVEPTTPYTAEGNAYAVSQGKRLYRWYNCSACHATGGGGDWGPALSDDRWLYGGQPPDIFRSIVEGRPNGMPSFGGHISEDQVWQLVAYVRSLSGQLRQDVAPGRSDAIQGGEPEAMRDREPVRPDPAAPGTPGSAGTAGKR